MKAFHFFTTTLLLFTTFFLSCTSGVLEEVNQQEVKNAFSSKASFMALTPEEQKIAWISRLKMYSDLDLTQAQKELVNELISDLKELEKDQFHLTENLIQDAISLAKITPQVDFLNLFCENMVSLPVLHKTGPICSDCITALENYVRPTINDDGSVTFRAVDCDCNWTCQQQEDNMLCPSGQTATTLTACTDGQTTDCCNQTASGCGFLNGFSCTGHVTCVDY